MATERWAERRWRNFPFGRTPRASEARYKSLWEKERTASYPEIDAFEAQAGYAIDRDWFHDLALHTQIVIKDSPLCYQHGRVLYTALRHYLKTANFPGPETGATILETGTARGFSATIMARALRDHGIPGSILTFDLLPHDTPMLWNCIDDLGGPRTRRRLLAPWEDLIDPCVIFLEMDSRRGLRKVATGRLRFAFLDGAHTARDVAQEFEAVQMRQKPGDTIVFDDYSPRLFPGLVRAVEEGCIKWGYEKDTIRAGGDRAYVIARKSA